MSHIFQFFFLCTDKLILPVNAQPEVFHFQPHFRHLCRQLLIGPGCSPDELILIPQQTLKHIRSNLLIFKPDKQLIRFNRLLRHKVDKNLRIPGIE